MIFLFTNTDAKIVHQCVLCVHQKQFENENEFFSNILTYKKIG